MLRAKYHRNYMEEADSIEFTGNEFKEMDRALKLMANCDQQILYR